MNDAADSACDIPFPDALRSFLADRGSLPIDDLSDPR